MGERRKFTNGYKTDPLTDEEALRIANSVMKSDWFYNGEYYSGEERVFFPFTSDDHDTRFVVVDRTSQKRFVKSSTEVMEDVRHAERKVLGDLSDKLYEWG